MTKCVVIDGWQRSGATTRASSSRSLPRRRACNPMAPTISSSSRSIHGSSMSVPISDSLHSLPLQNPTSQISVMDPRTSTSDCKALHPRIIPPATLVNFNNNGFYFGSKHPNASSSSFQVKVAAHHHSSLVTASVKKLLSLGTISGWNFPHSLSDQCLRPDPILLFLMLSDVCFLDCFFLLLLQHEMTPSNSHLHLFFSSTNVLLLFCFFWFRVAHTWTRTCIWRANRRGTRASWARTLARRTNSATPFGRSSTETSSRCSQSSHSHTSVFIIEMIWHMCSKSKRKMHAKQAFCMDPSFILSFFLSFVPPPICCSCGQDHTF